MTPTTAQHAESFELTKSFEATGHARVPEPALSTRQVPVLRVINLDSVKLPMPAGYESLEDVIAEFERDPEFRKEMRNARAWMADTVMRGEAITLRTLRLRQGMSQAQLAESIGTQQPHIARIERGHTDLRLETCRKLAVSLGVDLNTLDQALQRKKA